MPKVLMSFHYKSGWQVVFFDTDRRRSQLPRKAFFNSDEALLEFIERAGGPKTLEDKNILAMQMTKNFGDVYLELPPEAIPEAGAKMTRQRIKFPKQSADLALMNVG
jgi:hypothetical protein